MPTSKAYSWYSRRPSHSSHNLILDPPRRATLIRRILSERGTPLSTTHSIIFPSLFMSVISCVPIAAEVPAGSGRAAIHQRCGGEDGASDGNLEAPRHHCTRLLWYRRDWLALGPHVRKLAVSCDLLNFEPF